MPKGRGDESVIVSVLANREIEKRRYMMTDRGWKNRGKKGAFVQLRFVPAAGVLLQGEGKLLAVRKAGANISNLYF